MPLIPLLLNRYVLAGLALLAIAAWGGYEKWRADGAVADLAVCEAQKVVLGQQIAAQNAAVDAMAEKARQQARIGAQALARARASAQVVQPEIARMEAAIAKPEGKSCGDALAIIRSTAAP